jgi:hypothetical protein
MQNKKQTTAVQDIAPDNFRVMAAWFVGEGPHLAPAATPPWLVTAEQEQGVGGGG